MNLIYFCGMKATHFDFEELLEATTVDVTLYKLVVFNDDYNTFDHVIETLMKVCGHSPEQAEQCTFIIHFKGKCTVKTGEWENLAKMRDQICDAGISAEVTD
jgi:ATP-dependent Clp protease adaptor protein ClpS